ncbi:hypothetical protein HY621_01650, partial [Candidatus Uhrbacteria bacterium]|nr:hypothetical protein [Candidatus Uhrbacteria bacterium]
SPKAAIKGSSPWKKTHLIKTSQDRPVKNVSLQSQSIYFKLLYLSFGNGYDYRKGTSVIYIHWFIMAKSLERNKALLLRSQGKSYSQIKKEVLVSKGTLSSWLKGYPLSTERISELRDVNAVRIERYRNTMLKKREAKFETVYNKEQKLLASFSNRELYLAGLFLYWGEGSKNLPYRLSLCNTDPILLRFYIKWITKALGASKDMIRIHLQLYNDMNVYDETNYWSDALLIPKSQFIKPYIKATFKSSITHKGSYGHGTCAIVIHSGKLAMRVHAGLKFISNSLI